MNDLKSLQAQIDQLRRDITALVEVMGRSNAAIGLNHNALVSLGQRLRLLEAGLACIEIHDENESVTH